MAARPGLIHLHCGDAAATVHRKSGLPGDLRVWRDSPAVGPWARDAGELAVLRAGWWGVPQAEMRDLPHLEDLAAATEPVLWFGPDPWEQACLLWVLGELPEGTLPDLVPLDVSVGRMPPTTLPPAFAGRTLLGENTRVEAQALWKRYLVEGWGALAGERVVGLPHLEAALRRLAEDHPSSGPGRTQRQLQGLLEDGVRDLPGLLQALHRLEDLQHGAWYGDLFVARMVQAMGVRLG